MMNYFQLGRSPLRISAIGFGCMSLGEREEGARVIYRALDLGINFFDTADLYERGLNEERVGRILQGRRDEVVLATKVGNQWRKSDGRPIQKGAAGPTKRGADGPVGWDWNPRGEYIIKAVEDSLRRLRTDRIDLYQLHGGTIGDPIDETIGAFERLQQQGKIREYGLSSIRPNVIREYVRRSRIASVMMQYSLLDRRPEEQCLELLREAGIGVLVRGAVARGLLVNKPATAYLNYSMDETGRMAAAVKDLHGRNAAQTAIRYVLDHPAVTSVIVGIRTMEQLEEAVGVVVADPLTEKERRLLEGALPANRYEEHR